MAARVLLLRSKSPAGIEPRMEKEARALAEARYDVHVLLWDRERGFAAEEERAGFRIHRYPLEAPEGQPGLAPRIPCWWARAFWATLRLRPSVVHPIDFDTVVPAYLAAKIMRAKLVYEIFDFYAEMVTADLPLWLRRIVAKGERWMVPRADLVILPDRRREAQFQGASPKRLVEIMNVPEERSFPAEESSDFVVFYGGMIAKDRGLSDLALACESAGARLYVAGHGPDEAEILPLLETSPACMYLGTIPYAEVLRRTAGAHVVAALYDPAVPNNRFAAPNKLFEAMMLSKPVIVSDGIAAAELVREVGCGIAVPYGDREALRKVLERLMLSPSECGAMGARGRAAFESRYNWDAMKKRLLGAYGELLA